MFVNGYKFFLFFDVAAFDVNPQIILSTVYGLAVVALVLSISHKEILLLLLRVNQLTQEDNESKNRKNENLLSGAVCLYHFN